MDTGLKDKVVVVTGGANGIGRAICRAFAAEGSRVVVSDVDTASGSALAEEISGSKDMFVRLDVRNRSDVFDVFADVETRIGPIDVLVNNAGIITLKPLEDLDGDEWNKLDAVNVHGLLYCMQAAVASMKKRGGGKIVNLCSQTSKMGGSLDYAHYTASKAAAWNLTMSAAKRYASIPININGVAPGSIVETDFSKDFNLPMDRETILKSIPMGRRGTPEDIAPVVVFLASEGARYITGELIDINGGGLMD